jgi:hypothetical protein
MLRSRAWPRISLPPFLFFRGGVFLFLFLPPCPRTFPLTWQGRARLLYVYARACVCVCMCVYACVCVCVYIYIYIYSRGPVLARLGGEGTHRCTDVPMYQCTDVPIYRCTDAPMHREDPTLGYVQQYVGMDARSLHPSPPVPRRLHRGARQSLNPVVAPTRGTGSVTVCAPVYEAQAHARHRTHYLTAYAPSLCE